MSEILYWPGRGQSLEVLATLRHKIIAENNRIKIFDLKYDEGVLLPQKWREVYCNTADWWLGISLGASLSCYSLKYASNKPKRLTLINPFFSRRVLSVEKGFSLDKQWVFSLEDIQEDIDVDIVISIYDSKIPIHHAFEILTKSHFKTTNIIFVDDKHTIENEKVQSELASVLLGSVNEKNNYCYICEPKRG